MSHNNFNNKNLKDNSQNYTTKILNRYKRTNKFLNQSNCFDSRRAHSSSITKNDKYNLNSLIHNTHIYNMMNETRNKSPSNKLNQISKSHICGNKKIMGCCGSCKDIMRAIYGSERVFYSLFYNYTFYK